MRSRSGRPTLEEVAARAGVGRGTVSRVINGSPQVSPRVRRAVEQAIDELGYVPNRAARSLVTQRTDTVALVVSESGERFFAEPYFGRMVQAVSAALAETPYHLLMAIAQSPRERRRLEDYLTAQHVDGAILLALNTNDPLAQHLEEHGVPTVRVGRPRTVDSAYYVDADNRGGARLAVGYLAERGRRRIATIAGPQDLDVGVARLAGYRDGVDEPLVAYGDFSEASGAAAMNELLARHPDLDAVFAASDAMAAAAIRVLKQAGRRVAADVAVIGFDDSALAQHTDPALTSVTQPVAEMGRAMVELLLARVRGEQVSHREVVLDTRLVVRESA